MTHLSKLIIKEYPHWRVVLSEHQNYLGRCVVYCIREDAEDLSQATAEEREELFVIINEVKGALEKAFQPDWMNYTFLGNEVHHLHGHIIPRYEGKREFMSVTFEDKSWGKNYKTDKDFKVSEEVMMAIMEKVRENLK